MYEYIKAVCVMNNWALFNVIEGMVVIAATEHNTKEPQWQDYRRVAISGTSGLNKETS